MAGCSKAGVWFKVICDEKKKKEMMTKQCATGRLHKASSEKANMREAGDGQ